MYKGKVSKARAIQLYRDMQSSEPLAVRQSNVVDYVPASEVRDRVSASQIIHTQNVHHHHHYAPKPIEPSVGGQKTQKRTSDEELFFWLISTLGCTFSFGFLIAILIRG